MGAQRVRRMFDRVKQTSNPIRSIAELSLLSRSRSADRRLEALVRMRHQIETGGRRPGYLAAARRLVTDGDNDCRWQALIVVGEFIDVDPVAVWQVVRRHGGSPDDDMRMGVATVLLEHLLERNRPRYERLVRREIAAGKSRFADTLASCWDLGLTGRRLPNKRLHPTAPARSRKRLDSRARGRRG